MQRLLGFRRIFTTLRCGECEKIQTKCLLVSNIGSATRRTYMARTSETLENQLKSRDMIPEDFEIIYRGGMDNYIHAAYTGSTILLSIGAICVYKAVTADKPISFPIKAPSTDLIGIQNYTQLSMMYGSFFLICYAMRSISWKYVLRMYYNEKTQTYRAIMVGFLPMATRPHDFPAKTVSRITKKSVVPWWNIQFNCNGRKLMLFEDGFRTSSHYNRMFLE